MRKKVCYHYLFIGEKRITEIYALYELKARARKKADEILLILSWQMEKKDDNSKISERLFIKLWKKTKHEPQKELLWKVIEIIGDELCKKVAMHETK